MIDHASANGGGEIVIPPGDYTFTPLRLRSNICLTISAGARLTASPNRADYFPVGYDHNEMGQVTSALYAIDAENVTLRGEGTIDLNGASFYHMDEPTDVHTVGPEITQAHLDEAPRSYDWRVNQPIFFLRCKRIKVDGLNIVNAPCWTFSFTACRTITVDHLNIDNSLILPNNDGMHFSASSDIVISNCHVIAGDDCVALSCITDFDSVCEDVVVSNCVFQSASKAISIGFKHSIVRNVLIDNVIVRKSNRAFVSMCHPGTGLVENVRVSNCILEGRAYGGNWWGNGESIVLMVSPQHLSHFRDPEPETRFDASMRNISFSNVTCRSPRPIGIVSTMEGGIRNVQLDNVVVEIIPDEMPSLKGNVIDLAPGPKNLSIPARVGIAVRNAAVRTSNVVDPNGDAVEVYQA